METLGEWYEKGKILTFVQSKDKCDLLFKDLIKHGYLCISFHGAKDQTDRESVISDFKINCDVPNHYEDYVHRVGRTGRAVPLPSVQKRKLDMHQKLLRL